MGRWTREEIDDAFKQYQAMGLKAARSGNWNYWGDMFTENCTYHEWNLGSWAGRDAIVRNMSAVMHLSGNTELGEETRDNGVQSDPWVEHIVMFMRPIWKASAILRPSYNVRKGMFMPLSM